MKKSKGFTLIELMVVIVILGILAAVIAPRIPGFVNKAKEGRTKGNLGNIRSAMNIYYGDNDGIYPVTTDLSSMLVPKYLKEIPKAEMPPYHSASNSITGDTGASAITPSDTGGWIYNHEKTSRVWGDIIPNCNAHSDSSNTMWSSY
ncbi:MAG: type II secretion system protein [Elusimicrobiota bacterium]